MQNIGNRIIRLREANNLTQAEMAERLGVSRQTVSSWESGRTCPGANMLQEICNAFEVDLNCLITQSPNFHKTKRRNHKMLAKRFLLAASVLICAAHIVFSFLGKVHFFHVLICPLLIMFIHLIIQVAFSNSINNNDFTMIAGYKKTDSVKKTAAILNSIGLFTGIVAVV